MGRKCHTVKAYYRKSSKRGGKRVRVKSHRRCR